MTKVFKLKRSTVDARQWDGTRAGIAKLCDWVNRQHDWPAGADEHPLSFTHTNADDVVDVLLWTVTGDSWLSPTDWIVSLPNNNWTRFDDLTFKAFYDVFETEYRAGTKHHSSPEWYWQDASDVEWCKDWIRLEMNDYRGAAEYTIEQRIVGAWTTVDFDLNEEKEVTDHAD